MPRAYQQGDEPVRGYRLGKFLGKGGFGDVWQAHGPGGTEVAFKIIRLDDKPGFTNLRTVELLKKIKHPNLCPILALWISDFSTTSASGILKKKELSGVGNNDKSSTHTLGEFNLDDLKPTAETLFIAMGLGDKSLLERFTECKDRGEQGIPSVELISYIEDAARAIDHLNAPKHDLGKGLQTLPHGDIKPQNILIVGGAAQVCDAGLRHVLGEMDRGAAGMTVAFSSPEMLDGGKPSPYSDQYSLAITYHYLRTGALPFSMNDANVVLTEALEGRLDLSRLSTAEQQVIRRAVSRRPEARFANCQDLARELRRAIERTGSGPTDGLVIEPNREIVPGHKLISLIGRGAYGEVWQSQAPGRLPIALKIIKDLDRASGRGKQEFRALEIIQNISHNSLMELRAYWLLDRHGQIIPDELRGHAGAPTPATLVIATRLADKNLSQVLEKHKEAGKPGIPVKELLGYLSQVAGALDYLNQPRHKQGNRLVSIQHRDVKPDNIMLANDTVKLTDFGLAKVLETENISAEIKQDSVGFTFHYAAPEVLRGKVTKWSDQYSLAITYFQLRTGQLPYGPDCSAYDQMMRQLEGQLDLSVLLKAERQVVAKATSVIPEERYESCQAFVNALMKAVPATGELLIDADDEMDEPAVHKPLAAPGYSARHQDPVTELQPATPRHGPVQKPAETREPSTMNVALRPGEIYPAPVHHAERDTDPEPSAPTAVMPVAPAAVNAEAETAPKPLKHYALPLAMVFIVGIGMAMLVYRLVSGNTESAQASSTTVEPMPDNTTREFVGPVYDPARQAELNNSSYRAPDIITAADNRPSPPPMKVPDLIVSPTPTKPIPAPIFVLGKNITDPGFPSFLQTSLDRIITSTRVPAEFSRSYRELEQVPSNAISTKLLAFRAECMLESDQKKPALAEQFLRQGVELQDRTAYLQYVQARYWQEMREPLRAVAALEESLKQDISLSGFRRERALSILEEAAQRVSYQADARSLTTVLSEPVPTWLGVAERFMGKAQTNSLLSLVLAVQGPVPKDPSTLQAILTPAMQEEWARKPQGAIVVTSLKLKLADSLVKAKQPASALNVYAEIWNYLKTHRDHFEATSPLIIYQRIIDPGQKVAATIKANPTRNTQLAALQAAYGEFIFQSPYEAWPGTGNKQPLRVAAEAYAEAAKLFPGGGRIKAEYLTGQGQCLNRLGSLAPSDIAAISTNASAATLADPTFHGGWNILGLAKYYRLAQETSETDIRRTLSDSIAAYDKAISLAEQQNPRDRVLAQYRSNRSLARSMLGDFTPIENEQRRYVFQDAVTDAVKATELDASYESAWGALGQAKERLGNLLSGVPARTVYAEAEKAYRQQLSSRPSLAQGHAYLGRCLVRWAVDDGNNAMRLEAGREELTKAIKLDTDLAEAHFWLGRYYLLKNDAGRANEEFLKAIRHPDLGKNFLNQTLALLYNQPTVLQPLLNQVIPANLNQCKVEHVTSLIVRSTLARRPINTGTKWEDAKPVLEQCIADAQMALQLAPVAQRQNQADALEASSTAKLLLFVLAPQADKANYRQATMNDIRALLKTNQPTAGQWELASYLAKFLSDDALEANDAQAKPLLEEALRTLDISLALAPSDKKEQLRRFRNDLQARVK